MRILIDLGHPAHFHLFKNAAFELEKRGHRTFWAARRKDVLVDLLEAYRLPYRTLTMARPGLLNLLGELVRRDYEVYKMSKELQIDLMLGVSISIAQVSAITRAQSIVFNDDDAKAGKVFARLTYPFADTIVTPDCLRHENLGAKHIKYPSYHALAYLHPHYFGPDPGILDDISLREGDRYFILRFVSLEASHDMGEAGISLSMRRKLIRRLSKFGRVFITAEKGVLPEFKEYELTVAPDKIHDLLYYATMFIGDGQTMTAEAAVLGTPAIRCNTFVRRISYLEELEHKYGLTYGFLPSDEERMLDKTMKLLSLSDLKEIWRERRSRMLQDKIDLTRWMVDFIEDYPDSFYGCQRRMNT